MNNGFPSPCGGNCNGQHNRHRHSHEQRTQFTSQISGCGRNCGGKCHKCRPTCPTQPICPPPPPMITQTTEAFPGLRVVRTNITLTQAVPGTYTPSVTAGAGVSVIAGPAAAPNYPFTATFTQGFGGIPTITQTFEAAGAITPGFLINSVTATGFTFTVTNAGTEPLVLHFIIIGPVAYQPPCLPSPPFPGNPCCNPCPPPCGPCGPVNTYGGYPGYQ
jgi:hypothetical protein